MEKQKEQLQRLLERLGYEQDVASDIAGNFLETEGDGAELPIDGILLKAQEYARPILRSTLKREFSHEFKGQYMGEAINKVVAASKGKIRRVNYEDGNLERALQDLVGVVSREATDNSQSEEVIADLKQQIEALALDKDQAIQQLKAEFGEKENARMVYDALYTKLGTLQSAMEGRPGKRLSVEQGHAARTILRELGEEYVLRYDEEAKEIGVYNKAKPEERIHDGQKFVGVNELIERSLVRNNWIAQSNGGSISPRQFQNRPQHVPVRTVTEGSEFRKKLEAQVGAGQA